MIEVWTDLGCPWCYLAKHRLDQAIDQTGISATILLRSFELHPDTPRDIVESIPEYFVRVHGTTLEHARSMEGQMGAMANAEGLPFEIERPAANTFDVHRLLQLANAHGVGTEYFSAAQDAYFAGEFNPYDHDALIAFAVDAGVPADEALAVLQSDAYGDAVLAERANGVALGVTGVPFIVYDGRFATSGAQTVAGYVDALQQVVATVSATSGAVA